jgi:hypothetical protein
MTSVRPVHESMLSTSHRAAWRELDDSKNALRRAAVPVSVEERLRRGQRLSSQAARLRRAVQGDERTDPRS